jgi:putative lipoprotein
MTTGPETQNNHGEPDSQEGDKKRWLIPASVVVGLILLGILTYAILTSAGFLEPQGTAAFITITEPAQGAVLDTTSPVTVTGQSGGLFEGSLVIQALNAAGNVLAQQPTIIDSPEAGTGGEGPWSVELEIISPPGTQGQIVAFSTSPVDGSTIASAEVDVVFGDVSLVGNETDLRDHLWVLASLNGRSLIEDTLINLHFNDFLVEGLGGCNLYTTSYERRRSNLNFGLVTSTAKDCELPVGIMSQEKAYFNALEQTTTFTIQNQQLNLFDGPGNLILVFNAAVRGRVVALEGREIPEGAVVYIQLVDVSLADAEATQIVEKEITDATEFPIPFAITYDPKEIMPGNTYAIQVRVEDSSGNLYFSNTTTNLVISGENISELDVTVDAVQ